MVKPWARKRARMGAPSKRGQSLASGSFGALLRETQPAPDEVLEGARSGAGETGGRPLLGDATKPDDENMPDETLRGERRNAPRMNEVVPSRSEGSL